MYVNLGEVMSPATFAMLRHGKHYEVRLGTSKGLSKERFLALDDEHALAFGKEYARRVAEKTGAKVQSLTVLEIQERPVSIMEDL
jgi:hypothetical protein